MSANTFRYRGGDVRSIEVQTCPRVNLSTAAVDQINGTQLYPIQEGDLVGLVQVVAGGVTYNNCAVPAGAKRVSNDTYTTMQPVNTVDPGQLQSNVTSGNAFWTTAANFYKSFGGVALMKRGLQSNEVVWKLNQSIDPGWLSIATSGRFEYDVVSTDTAHVFAPGEPVKIAITASVAVPQQVAHSDLTAVDYIAYAVPSYSQLQQAASVTVGQTNSAGIGQTAIGQATIIIDIRPQSTHATLASGS